MRFRRSDAVALILVPLVVVAVTVGSEILPIICLCLGALIVYAIAGHHELLWQRRVAVCGVAAVLDLAVASYLYRVNLATELKQQVAPLIAATLPSPVSSNCPIPKGAVALYLGNTVSVVTEFPHVVFRVHSENVLALDRDASGLLISFTAFDDGGNILSRLNRNVFIAISAASYLERP